jgi:hypothetical protein
MVSAIGTCAKLAKIDVKAAFRCVHVHPSDRWLLCMKWCNSFYADLALPFGLKSSPCIWERYATLTEWILRRAGVAFIVHYVDDFLVGGSADSDQCADAVAIIVREFKRFGIPLSLSKFEAEATSSTIARFLSIVIDTLCMETRLDPECLAAIKASLKAWLQKSTCKPAELQSLIGVLSFAAKVVPAGRTFLRRMITTLTGGAWCILIMLGPDFMADVRWLDTFITAWNGVALLPDAHWSAPGNPALHTAPSLGLRTDACTTGFGAVWDAKWVHSLSPEQLNAAKRKDTLSMPYLELLSVALALCTWRPLLMRQKLTIECDAVTSIKAFRAARVLTPHSCTSSAQSSGWLPRINSHCAAFTSLARRTWQPTFSRAAMCSLSVQLFQSTMGRHRYVASAPPLVEFARDILLNGLDQKSRSSYHSGQKSFFRFCDTFGVAQLLPAATVDMCMWMVSMTCANSPSTLQAYRWSLHALHTELGQQ